MRRRVTPLVLALGLMALGVAPAAMAGSGRDEGALPILLVPGVARGCLHPDPGLYLLCPHDAEPGCVRLDQSEVQVEKAAPLPESAVVLIHGLDDCGDVWRELAPALHDSGRTV